MKMTEFKMTSLELTIIVIISVTFIAVAIAIRVKLINIGDRLAIVARIPYCIIIHIGLTGIAGKLTVVL